MVKTYGEDEGKKKNVIRKININKRKIHTEIYSHSKNYYIDKYGRW